MSLDINIFDAYAVDMQAALNFWNLNFKEALGRDWTRVPEPVRLYLITILSHFCLEPQDRQLILSDRYRPGPDHLRQFADLSQIAELVYYKLFSASPCWMESAGAHILLYAGFFQAHFSQRHNIATFADIGESCYLMAAVGERKKLMRRIASGFKDHLSNFKILHDYLEFKRYQIRLYS